MTDKIIIIVVLFYITFFIAHSWRLFIKFFPCLYKRQNIILCFIALKGSVPLRPGEKKKKIRKSKWCSLFGLIVLQCFNSYMKKYQSSKLNTYLITAFFSEWGYCVYIEIPLRLSPAPTFRALKNMSAVMLHFLIHICEYRLTL